ncbi:MAG: hypothetical protein APF80_15435 [Alphaproteobacteria bacterium BRH_c36]|nr:MAG: hypothetical protein APF80_15435 [Alphaproteobacteria bacterium BRH_c36]
MTLHPLAERALAVLKRLAALRPDLRLVAAALCAMGILHIAATLAAPMMMGRSAFDRLEPMLPVNTVIVLPPVTPATQPLPFLTPDVRYAMCRYDSAQAPVGVSLELPGKGWSLALHTPEGDNVYAATGEDERVTSLRLRILPTAERFMGLTPESLGVADTTEKPQAVRSDRGIIVLRAPDKGRAYRPFIEAGLRRFTCAAEKVR